MLAQRRRWWPSIISALGQCIMLSVIASIKKGSPHNNAAVWKHGSITNAASCRASVEDCGSILKQHWVNARCLRKVYSWPSDGLVLGQRRRRFTDIKLAMSCDAALTVSRNLWVSLHSLYEVHRRQLLNECRPATAMVVEGIHVEEIFHFVSLVLSLIISWTFRILAHEEDQYTVMFRKY